MSKSLDIESKPLQWRDEALNCDLGAVQEIVAATGFFSTSEVEIAVELVAERLAKGAASGYEFRFAQIGPTLVGYTCFGEIPCTVGSYDIYWIIVHPSYHRQSIGRTLMLRTEEEIKQRCGRKIYIDTSGKEQYESTRRFYAACGYRVATELTDFYDVGDSKVVFTKDLSAD